MFLREIGINIGLASKRTVTFVKEAGGEETHEIDTVSYEKGRSHAAASIEPLVHLANAQRRRELDDLARRRDFLLFPGGEESRREARSVLRELVGTAMSRCWLLDPYLSSDDAAELVPFIKSTQCDVRLLSSHSFLSSRDRSGKSVEARLAERVTELNEKLRLPIFARKLPGREKSPVHDRVLVVDDAVFMIGSSLSELGSRATTVFRAPHPDKLTSEFLGWWQRASVLDSSPRPRSVKEDWAALRGHLRGVRRAIVRLVSIVILRRAPNSTEPE